MQCAHAQALVATTMAFGVANRVLYKMALVPLGDYVFFLAQFQTFGYVLALVPLWITSTPCAPLQYFTMLRHTLMPFRPQLARSLTILSMQVCIGVFFCPIPEIQVRCQPPELQSPCNHKLRQVQLVRIVHTVFTGHSSSDEDQLRCAELTETMLACS